MGKKEEWFVFFIVLMVLFSINVSFAHYDVSSCENYERSAYDECQKELIYSEKIEISIKQNNPSLCFYVGNPNECVAKVATSNHNVFACNVFNTTNTPGYEEEFINELKSECASKVALFFHDPSFCSEGIGSKEICLAKVSLSTGDIGICESVKDALWKSICISELSFKKGDITLCSKLQNEEEQGSCYEAFINSENLSPESCNQIDLEQWRESCLSTISTRTFFQTFLQLSPYLFYSFSVLTLIVMIAWFLLKKLRWWLSFVLVGSAFLAIFFRFYYATPNFVYFEQAIWPHYLVLWAFALAVIIALSLKFKNLVNVKDKKELMNKLIQNYILIFVFILLIDVLTAIYLNGAVSFRLLDIHSWLFFPGEKYTLPGGSWQFLFWGIVSYHFVTKLKSTTKFKGIKLIKYARTVSLLMSIVGVILFLFSLFVIAAIAGIS